MMNVGVNFKIFSPKLPTSFIVIASISKQDIKTKKRRSRRHKDNLAIVYKVIIIIFKFGNYYPMGRRKKNVELTDIGKVSPKIDPSKNHINNK